MRPRIDLAKQPRTLLGEHSAVIAGPDWRGYVPIRVKTFRAAMLDGQKPFTSAHLNFSQAGGVLEIVGGRVGQHSTELWVGFTLDSALPEPTFLLTPDMAVGTLVLPSQLLPAWLSILSQPAHFRIGGDGKGNALSSSSAFLD